MAFGGPCAPGSILGLPLNGIVALLWITLGYFAAQRMSEGPVSTRERRTWTAAFLLLGVTALGASYLDAQSNRQNLAKVAAAISSRPPMRIDGDLVSVDLGTSKVNVRKGGSLRHLFRSIDLPSLDVRLTPDGRLLLDCEIRDSKGRIVASISESSLSVDAFGSGYDLNSDRRGFEVVDSTGQPVFQVRAPGSPNQFCMGQGSGGWRRMTIASSFRSPMVSSTFHRWSATPVIAGITRVVTCVRSRRECSSARPADDSPSFLKRHELRLCADRRPRPEGADRSVANRHHSTGLAPS